MHFGLMRKNPKSKRTSQKNVLTLSGLAKLEKLEQLKLDEIKLITSIKTLSSLDGFNAELALQYIKLIQTDKDLDVLRLVE